jgi:hypothetical protein
VYATDLCGISSANSDITIGFPLNYLSTATGYFQSTMGDQPIPTDYMAGIDIDTNFTGATWGAQYVSSASYFSSLIIAHRTSCGDVTSEWTSFYTVGLFQTGIYSGPILPTSYSVEESPSAATKYRILIIPNILLLDPVHMEPLFPNPIRSNRALYLSCSMVNMRSRGIWVLRPSLYTHTWQWALPSFNSSC